MAETQALLCRVVRLGLFGLRFRDLRMHCAGLAAFFDLIPKCTCFRSHSDSCNYFQQESNCEQTQMIPLAFFDIGESAFLDVVGWIVISLSFDVL